MWSELERECVATLVVRIQDPFAMPDDLNVFETAAWERELGPARGARVGAAAGARELGCSLYEVDPGGQATPYHAHYANEELLIVLDGVLELRTPERTREVAKGAAVAFPVGAAGAHRLRNVSDAPARYLLVSTMRFPEVAEQLDTGTILAMKGPADGWAFQAGSAGDYMALTIEAIKADHGH
jgi:uncharacterized cupin superfamily protein